MPPVPDEPPRVATAPPAPATRPPGPGAAAAYTGSGAAPAGEDPRRSAAAPPVQPPPVNSPPSGMGGADAPPRPDGAGPAQSAVGGRPRDGVTAAAAGDRPAGGPPPHAGGMGVGALPQPDGPGQSASSGSSPAASGSAAGDRPVGGPPPRPDGPGRAQSAAGSDPREGPPGPAGPASATPAPGSPPFREGGARDGAPPRSPAPGGHDAPGSPAPVPRAVVPAQAPRGGVVGDGPPTYDPEPSALPAAETDALDQLVADTVLDGASYGTYTLRAASVRGDSARFRGEPRRDALLTARFGSGPAALVLVAVAGGIRGSDTAHLAAADACRWIGRAVGRSHARLAEDIRAGRRGDLKSGLHRLTDRSLGRLRARAAELGVEPETYTAGLRCLLLSADPACRTRVFFGVGGGGLFRLRDGVWQDLEPPVPDRADVTGAPVVGFGSAVPEATPGGDRLTMDLGIPTGPAPYIEAPPPPVAEPFRFRASVARPGDTLLLCSPGLAAPVRGEAALAKELAERWHGTKPPGMAQFLADTQLRVKGYADDRTAVAVWEA
ncbi:protein phosphatase 2C domain-containing protein [Streptomyces sp. NPDC086835]|uniref:protein phosphatase 2C domain-containing protein n=1 Tax=Streptomyces sp. NPDC086835 TaxID=3365761 RepID=UPI00381840E4